MSEGLSSINQQTTSAGEDVEKGEPFCSVGRNADFAATVESSMVIPQKIKNVSAFWPRDPTSRNISEGTQNTNLKEHKHPIYTAALFTITKIWKPPKCPSVDGWKNNYGTFTQWNTTRL